MVAEKLAGRQKKSARWMHRHGIGGHWLARKAIRQNFSGAGTLYVHPCVATDAVFEAKKRGLRVVIETISHPFSGRLEHDEIVAFGSPPPVPLSVVEDNITFFEHELGQADIILAASEYVKSGLIQLGVNPARVALVPYGLELAMPADDGANPIKGRALYVGTVGYLKGTHHLAAASRLPESRGTSFRVVGPLVAEMRSRPEFQGPTYIGQLPRTRVKEEYSRADVFVFPTLSDGFGIVLLEAMAAGLPVVTTENCAGIVQDGINGFVIPLRDPQAIADRVGLIINDRRLRGRMSEAARATAKRFSLRAYGDALVTSLQLQGTTSKILS
jgi:glycosyltransferase involved in cell wall biosynthesis